MIATFPNSRKGGYKFSLSAWRIRAGWEARAPQAGCLCSDLGLGQKPVFRQKNLRTRSTNSLSKVFLNAIIWTYPSVLTRICLAPFVAMSGSCDVERSETSLNICLLAAEANDLRFLASLGMTVAWWLKSCCKSQLRS